MNESFGGVVVSGGNRVLLREPAQHHGGYVWTFSKTQVLPNESPRDVAVRAVREKTGYQASILCILDGMYKGADSSTNFYLMDAAHPPAQAGWQTAGLRWVTFHEAHDLIGQTTYASGRQRDWAVLATAAKMATFMAKNRAIRVQPQDFGNPLSPMPLRHAILKPELRYTCTQMDQIKRGYCPTDSDYKWFLYFTGDRLRMHRSWTGLLIYDVGFSFDSIGDGKITDVIINRDPDQYGGTDDAEDLAMVKWLIEYCLLAGHDA